MADNIGNKAAHEYHLDAPVARVAAANVVSPFSPPLEDAMFPHPADIVAAAHKLLAK